MDETINKLLTQGKGILAADESTATIKRRFEALGLYSTPELNKKYREMLFTTPGIESYLSGVILFDESARQGLHKILERVGIIPGIKVDGGLESFNDTGEKITLGLDGLNDRLVEYSDLGLKFTKWRMAIMITDNFPSSSFLEVGLNDMVEFAILSQTNNMVPIVEPEVLLDGNHTTTRCEEIETKVLKLLFEKAGSRGVDFSKLILKTSMVLPGRDSGVKAAPLEVAQATLRALKRSVPEDVAGVVFLSGGQTPDESILNLSEIVKLKGDAPWEISFSFSRALQEDAMSEWGGMDENVHRAQEIFLKRVKAASDARLGLVGDKNHG